VLTPFLDCLHQFDPKTIPMMLVLMFDPIFKVDIYTLNNYAGIEKTIIVATRYNFETLIPLLCLAY
jgi:ACR3 family arsenite efflux pump ArsB